MKELYVEDLASHDDPESCAAVREDGGEALTGACAGSGLSREIKGFGVPTPLTEAEGNIVGRAFASGRWTPRGRRPGACTRVSGRENREIPRSPAVPTDASPYGFAGWWCGARRVVRGTLRR